MNEAERLVNIVRWRHKPNKASRLGDTLTELMDERISPKQARFERIADVWSELLPVELEKHSRIADISGGQLEVAADSPVYMHELRLCSSELLTELQRQCPQAKIKKLKIVLGL